MQLAAAEEYRKNFELTDIRSAKESPSTDALEIFLPGSHSDVGGGYVDRAAEINRRLVLDNDEARLERQKQWLVDAHWYTEEQLRVEARALVATRTNIYNAYAHIALRIMANLAHDCARSSRVFFHDALRWPVSSDLDPVKQSIDHYVERVRGGRSSEPDDWINSRLTWAWNLRRYYLHFSAHYNDISDNRLLAWFQEHNRAITPMEPRWNSDDERERDIHAG